MLAEALNFGLDLSVFEVNFVVITAHRRGNNCIGTTFNYLRNRLVGQQRLLALLN